MSQSPRSRSGLTIGSVVERFEVLAECGRGASSTVYQVRHTHLGVLRALKVLGPIDAVLSSRLMLEGQVLASLVHPNIVAVHDVVFIDNTTPALVLDWVCGPTLEELVAQAELSWDDAVALWVAVVRGVAAAHSAGVVHRDLKPSNVLLDTSQTPPVPRVVDFGLARVAARADHTPSRAALSGVSPTPRPSSLTAATTSARPPMSTVSECSL